MTLKKTIIFIVVIFAAILVPLGLISGAVSSVTNYSEYQIVSTPQSTVEVSDVKATEATVSFSIDRSNYVILSSVGKSTGDDTEQTTKYKYTSDYNILLIDMTKYNDAVKHIKGSEAVSIQGYVDRTYNVLNDELVTSTSTIKSGELGYTISTVDTYLLTADTQFQEGKEYFTKTGAEYVLAEFKVGAEVEKGEYYEKAKNTSFSFGVANLIAEHDYAIAIQFYYSTNDKGNTLYNKGLQERKEFTTKK